MSVPFTPRPYQQSAAKFLIETPRCMLVADPGLGKTGTVLMALDMLKMVGSSYFPALVLAPKRVADIVWTAERDKWTDFQGISMIKLTGEREARLSALRQPVADVYVCNYELVPWLTEQWSQEKWPFKILIADECSRLKGFRLHGGTKRAAALSNVARYTGRYWGLTGTPVPNGMQDLWGEMWFVDFGERLKRTYTAFKEAYFMENPYTHKITPQQGAEAAIAEAVKDVLVAYRAEDCLDITQPQTTAVEFDLPERAARRYREMERDFFVELDAETQIEAGTAMVKSSKLLQMCAGSVYDEHTSAHSVQDARLEALDDVLDQIEPEPLLVGYWWKFDPPRLLAYLKKRGIKARVYAGKQDEDDWNAGKIRVLLLHMQSAFGLNLHAVCHDVCFYSYYWNAELWQQMVERVGAARQAQLGLKRAVRVWSIRARGTIDGDVIDSNFKKITVEQALKRARAQRYV